MAREEKREREETSKLPLMYSLENFNIFESFPQVYSTKLFSDENFHGRKRWEIDDTDECIKIHFWVHRTELQKL